MSSDALGVHLWELFKFEEPGPDKSEIERFALRLRGEKKERVDMILEIADVVLSTKIR